MISSSTEKQPKRDIRTPKQLCINKKLSWNCGSSYIKSVSPAAWECLCVCASVCMLVFICEFPNLSARERTRKPDPYLHPCFHSCFHSWWLLVFPCAFWCFLVLIGSFWCFLVFSGAFVWFLWAFWCFLVLFGASWYFLGLPGAFCGSWCFLWFPGAFWCFLVGSLFFSLFRGCSSMCLLLLCSAICFCLLAFCWMRILGPYSCPGIRSFRSGASSEGSRDRWRWFPVFLLTVKKISE